MPSQPREFKNRSWSQKQGLEEKNGFMRHNGCCDGIFTVKMALQNRHHDEPGLITWVGFIDLIKTFAVFKQFGHLCHVSRDSAKSKSEAMYFPLAPPCLKYKDTDTCSLQIDEGEVPFTQKFKLQGSMLAYNLQDDADSLLK